MKKLSLLVALALLITVGGVYATWSFTSENSDIVDVKYESVVTLADATTSGAAGTYTISSNLVLSIDQKAEGDHTAVLRFLPATTGDEIFLDITFTPAVNAPEAVKNFGVPSELYLSTTTEMKCKVTDGHFDPVGGTEQDIFLLANEANSTLEGNPDTDPYAIKWQKEGNVFKAHYDVDDLKGMIELNGTIKLDTKADYDEFSALLNGNIVVHITDGKVNGTVGQG